ncbi:MAG: UDP-N-acetylglucosamine--N-acetylmuramyl-(pentapeptide) pyrophosphoryl-undecaprenol N-acetylglucosamine transferase, partial [Methylocystis sp.]
GGADTEPQSDFTPEYLTVRLCDLISAPAQLAASADAAKSVGVADAAERLADLILDVARRGAAKRS